MSLGQAIAAAVNGAFREAFGGVREVKRRVKHKPVVVCQHRRVKPVAETKRRVKAAQPAVRPFRRGEYDSMVLAACDQWRTVAEMRKRPGLTGVIASRLSTKCLAMLRAGKLIRRERNLTPLEYEYRRIEAAR